MASAFEKELAWFETEFSKLSNEEREQLLEQFRVEHAKTPGDKHFCSIMQAPIAVPCRLTGCQARVDNPGLLNCGLFYRGISKRASADLAKTYSVPEETAKTMISDAVRKLRMASLDETIEQKKINRYYLVPSEVCVNCGAETNSKTQFKAGKFKYCSRVCFQERPPSLLKLEHRFKTDIRNVLNVSKTLFRSVILISNVLSIPRSHLLRFYERYLGIKPHEFGSDVADLIDLLRKQKPTPSIEDFIQIDPARLKRVPVWYELDRIGNYMAAHL